MYLAVCRRWVLGLEGREEVFLGEFPSLDGGFGAFCPYRALPGE